MRLLRFALWPFGVAFGVAAEWIGSPELAGLDTTAGFALLFLGIFDGALLIAEHSGLLQRRRGGELWPELPQIPDWRPPRRA